MTARADRSSSTSVGSRWRPGRSQAWPPHKPTGGAGLPMGDGSFHDDERRGTRAGRGSQGCLLCSSGYHRFANFQSYRFMTAALSDLRSLRRPLPVRTCPPGSGRGLFVSAYVVARGAGRRHGRSRLFDGRHGLCPCRDRESRLRSSTILEAPGPRLIKRSHQSRVRGAELAR